MIELEGVVRLSPSLVTGARQCGFRQAWLRCRPKQPFIETPLTAKSKSMHAALAQFHRRGGAATQDLDALLRFLRREWLGEPFSDPEEDRLARLECEAVLATYYALHGRDGGTLATEKSWNLLRPLGDHQTEWWGRMDWVRERPEGGIEVVDWKSKSHVPSPEALAEDPVTVMYARLAREFYERRTGRTEGRVWFSHLYLDPEQPRKVSVAVSREMVRAAEAELRVLTDGLVEGALPPAEGPWCEWGGGCPVRAAGECPLYPGAEGPTEVGEW